MKANKKKRDFTQLKKFLPYVLFGSLTLLVVIFGSLDKQNTDVSLSLDNFAANDYKVSVDQMSELYVVADLSDALGLASASDVASNYVITTTMYDSGQTSTGKLEKPNLTDISKREWITEYIVNDGENVDSIAAKTGISADQIRWSNGLKTIDVAAGTTLYIPKQSGIIYTVKSGDTIESIVEKYGSNSEEIIAFNDLEVSDISENMKLFIKDGSLPETERPEYVPPAPKPTYTNTYTYSYSYLGSTSERQNMRSEGYLYIGGGQCVDYALYKRPDLKALYGWSLGNANTWAMRATQSVVDRSPSAGAIFQTAAGYFGHVGYVEAVNGDGSIEVTEMNYGYIPYRVVRSTIPASAVGNFFYIH